MKLSNGKYERDFYVGKIKTWQKLAYRLRNHYLGCNSFLGRQNYNFVDLGHLFDPIEEEELAYDVEKAFINLSALDLSELCETIGLEIEYKVQIDGQDCSEYLSFQDKGSFYDIDISNQFWNDKPEMIDKLGMVINRNKNEYGKKLNVKCYYCGYEFKEIFECESVICPKCGNLGRWLYDWAHMLNVLS